MAQRIEHFVVPVPTGALQSAPWVVQLPFNRGIVERLEVLIPPGPSGLVGFQIVHSGAVIIPYDSSQWVVADNEVIKWELEGYPTGQAWAVNGYNTDVYDHTLYIRFLVQEERRAASPQAQLVYIAPGATAEDNLPSG